MVRKSTSIVVTSQAELDAALAAEIPEIIIDSPKGVWIDISTNGKSELSVRGSATIRYVRGSATIQYVRGSATIRDVRGSATIQYVRDSATIQYVGDSATIQYVGDSATIHLYGASKIDHTGSHVAVFLHSAKATTSGGVIIDLTALDLSVAKDWLDYHGVEIDDDGYAVLFKAVNNDWQTDRGAEWTYAPGNTVVAKDFESTKQCGQGLHLGITPHHSANFFTDATRYVAVKVKVKGLVPLDDKCKVRSCEVLYEVNIYGQKLIQA